LGGTLCKIGSPLLSFLLCSLCTPLQVKNNNILFEISKHFTKSTKKTNFNLEDCTIQDSKKVI